VRSPSNAARSTLVSISAVPSASRSFSNKPPLLALRLFSKGPNAKNKNSEHPLPRSRRPHQNLCSENPEGKKHLLSGKRVSTPTIPSQSNQIPNRNQKQQTQFNQPVHSVPCYSMSFSLLLPCQRSVATPHPCRRSVHPLFLAGDPWHPLFLAGDLWHPLFLARDLTNAVSSRRAAAAVHVGVQPMVS